MRIFEFKSDKNILITLGVECKKDGNGEIKDIKIVVKNENIVVWSHSYPGNIEVESILKGSLIEGEGCLILYEECYTVPEEIYWQYRLFVDQVKDMVEDPEKISDRIIWYSKLEKELGILGVSKECGERHMRIKYLESHDIQICDDQIAGSELMLYCHDCNFRITEEGYEKIAFQEAEESLIEDDYAHICLLEAPYKLTEKCKKQLKNYRSDSREMGMLNPNLSMTALLYLK